MKTFGQYHEARGGRVDYGSPSLARARSCVHHMAIAVRVFCSFIFLCLVAVAKSETRESSAEASLPAAVTSAHGRPAGYYELQGESREGENFAYAPIQGWLPPLGKRVRGILCVILHPRGGFGSQLESPEPWIAFAQRHDCALLGVSFVARNSGDDPWCHAAHGTGRALLASIDKLAEMSRTPELCTAPLMVAGICEAGQFAYEFAAFAPKRTVAFFTMGGSKHDLHLVGDASRVGGLLIAAKDRGGAAWENMATLFEEGRKAGAEWSFGGEPIAFYDQGNCSESVIHFLQKAMSLSEAHSSGTKAVVPDEGDPQKGGEGSSAVSNLSFVGTPLERLGATNPPRMEIGTVRRDKGQKLVIPVDFEVSTSPGSDVDEVRVVSTEPAVTCKSERGTEGLWRVSCQLNLEKLYSGGFRLELPIRFFRSGKQLYGGIAMPVTGRVLGDIRVKPSSINVSSLGGKYQQQILRLKSESGRPFEVLHIESTGGTRVKTEVVARLPSSAEIKCDFAAPVAATEGPFLGFITIHVKSMEESAIRVMFYGSSKVNVLTSQTGEN